MLHFERNTVVFKNALDVIMREGIFFLLFNDALCNFRDVIDSRYSK